ncbi:hypothetical protein OXX80_003780 [Metschnikowia pulcherrima]
MLIALAFDFVKNTQQHQFLALLLFLISAAIYEIIVYPLYVSPLRHIPGPYFHRISAIPSWNAQRKFCWIGKVHDLHEKYGNVVILSPKSISCNGDPKFLSDIYAKNMPKGKYYENFRFHGEVNMFCELDNEKHRQTKKMVHSLYSKSAIFNEQNSARAILVENVKELVNQVFVTSVSREVAESDIGNENRNFSGTKHHEKSQTSRIGAPINVHTLFGSLAMDVVSAFELGPGNGTHLLAKSEERSILTPHVLLKSMVFWTTRMPAFWNWAVDKSVLNGAKEIEDWQLSLYEKAEKTYEKAEKTYEKRAKSGNPSTLESLLKQGLSVKKAYSNVGDNLIAGHDTTATQLTYMCYELSRPVHEKIQNALRRELRDAFGDPKTKESFIDDLATVEKLPFLDALIQENLRVHSPAPGSEPRIVPTNYQMTVNGRKVMVPAGTEISCQPYSMHRTRAVFPDPDCWCPERWLPKPSESPEQYRVRVTNMQRYMMPFGRGIRMCLGSNLALIEMKLAIANLYWQYKSEISPDWCAVTPADDSGVLKMGEIHAHRDNDEGMMTKVDTYVSNPIYHECWLEWTHA